MSYEKYLSNKTIAISAADKHDVACPEFASVVEIKHHLRRSVALSCQSFFIKFMWYNSTMNVKGLQEKITIFNEKTRPYYKLYSQAEKEILTKTIKLNEEVGELCNDILSILKLQRKAKLEKFERKNIYQEFADVIITTIQLASVAGVDIERAIEDKMKVIEQRYAKELHKSAKTK